MGPGSALAEPVVGRRLAPTRWLACPGRLRMKLLQFQTADQTKACDPAARCARVLQDMSLDHRGRRQSRVPAAPAASRANLSEAHERSHHRFRRINRHSPRNGFTAYSALSPAIEFLLSPSLTD